MIKQIQLLVITSLFSLVTLAQKATVSGTVTDEKGAPLSGASITAKGSNVKVLSGSNGSFSLQIENGTVLTISFVGYEQAQVTAKANQPIVVKLKLAQSNLQDVVVLGSRGVPRTKLESTVPVDQFDIKNLITEIPQTDLTGILNTIAPSFNSTPQTVADGTDHIDPATVRGLGPDQTLVLLNGKRRYTSALVNLNGTMGRGSVGTDLNAIPAAAIDKIELLRDGAAAQYGSDAIAGVLNIQLNNDVNKGKATISYGANSTAYEAYTHANSGNFVNGVDPVYKKMNTVDGHKLQATVNYGWQIGKTKGSFINLTGVFEKRDPTIRSGERAGNIDDRKSGDVASQFLLDSLRITRESLQMRVGQSRTQNAQGVLNGAIKLKNDAEFYFFSILSQRLGNSTGFYRLPYQSTNIPGIFANGFLPEIGSNITDLSVGTGLKGKWNGWNYDLSNVYGENEFKYSVENSLNVSAWYAKGSRQTSFDAGALQFRQNTTNFDLSKSYNNALKTNLALGAEYRHENYQQKAGEEASWANYMRKTNGVIDVLNGTPTTTVLANGGSAAIPAGGAQVFPGFRPDNSINKSRNSFALYSDVEIQPAKGVLVDAAVRYENYSDFGGNLSGKIAARYKINNHISFRGAVSTGFRAPSLQQKYLTKTSTVFQGGIPYDDATLPNDSKAAQLLGIPNLRPEIAKNASLGVTMKYGGLTVTVDGFSTRVNDRIILTDAFSGSSTGTAQEQEIYNILLSNNASRGVFMTNAIDLKTSGIDAIATYSVKMPKNQSLKFELATTFTKRELLGNVKASAKLAGREHIYMSPINKATLIEGNPQVKGNIAVTYRLNKWSVLARSTYFGKVIHLESATVPNFTGSWFYRQELSAKVVTDISVGYRFTKDIRFSVGANNLWDVYSDLLKASAGRYYRLDVTPTSATYNTFIDSKTAKEGGVVNNNGVASNNQFNYSRRVTQLGMNGRYAFMKLEINL